VEINLKKKRNSHWLSLEKKEEDSVKVWNSSNPIVVDDKAKPRKNWDKLVKELEDTDKDEGTIQNTFQDIFKNADEDQRRAMEKSMYESGGTVLSTNWSEVGKGKVEVNAPDGMEAKKDL
jgi:suppressor of G2 allele of SKP1